MIGNRNALVRAQREVASATETERQNIIELKLRLIDMEEKQFFFVLINEIKYELTKLKTTVGSDYYLTDRDDRIQTFDLVLLKRTVKILRLLKTKSVIIAINKE